jgi:hypothetical protein
MGKAANNERIKLKAMYFNNISVGLVVAGALIPYLAIAQRASEILELFRRTMNGGSVDFELRGWIAAIFAIALAWWGAIVMRRRADRIIGTIED